jgi:uncharacterized membrane protein
MLLFGPLADIVPIDSLLVVTGAVIVLLSVPFVTSKTLRAAGTMQGTAPLPENAA